MFLLNPRTTSPRRCPQSIPVNWVLSMWRKSVSALSPSWSAKLLILSLRKRPATFWRKLISASCICDRGDTEISTDWDRVQPLSNRLVPEPKLCLQVLAGTCQPHALAQPPSPAERGHTMPQSLVSVAGGPPGSQPLVNTHQTLHPTKGEQISLLRPAWAPGRTVL